MGRATKRKAIIKVEFANMAQLKKEVGRGRLYIMPKNKITPDVSLFICMLVIHKKISLFAASISENEVNNYY